MKKLFLLLITCMLFASCEEKGVTRNDLNGSENNLPDELKGLKVYDVSTGGGCYVKVAVLNGKINSINYKEGKHEESVLILDRTNDASTSISISSIIMENDSIIIARK